MNVCRICPPFSLPHNPNILYITIQFFRFTKRRFRPEHIQLLFRKPLSIDNIVLLIFVHHFLKRSLFGFNNFFLINKTLAMVKKYCEARESFVRVFVSGEIRKMRIVNFFSKSLHGYIGQALSPSKDPLR